MPSGLQRVSGLRRRTGHEAGFDLAVTVGAHENALPCLLPVCGKRLPPPHVHEERLLGRVDVMEVQVDRTAGIPTAGATPAGLLNEQCAKLLVAASDRFSDAAPAAVPVSASALAVQAVFHGAVARAIADDRFAFLQRWTACLRDCWPRRHRWTSLRHANVCSQAGRTESAPPGTRTRTAELKARNSFQLS